MYCPNCGKEIADDAVVCIGCGRAVTPIKQTVVSAAPDAASVGAKLVHETASAFLVCGIINIIAGGLSIGIGWVFGIFAIIVGIIELVNAYQYWPIPPRKTSNPTFLPILEMLAALCGSLWSLLIGIANRNRLNRPEVKSYFLALQIGQPLNLVSSPPMVTSGIPAAGPVIVNQKKCPSCANLIPLEAKICQFCRQSFSDEEISAARQQLQAQLAQKQAEAMEKSKLSRGKTLRTIGTIIAIVGLLILVVFVIAQLASPTAKDNTQGFILAMVFCPTPLILLGGGLYVWGANVLRKLKEEKAVASPAQTMGI